MENIERNNESIHKLFTRLFGEITIQEPKGWSNDTRSYKRDKDSRSILKETEIKLDFYGDGADWITTVYDGYGIQETILISKYEKDKSVISEKWLLNYVQVLDLKTYKRDKKTGKVSVKATEGGLFDDIKNRRSDKYNIINTKGADGDDIGVLKTYPFQPQPRSIFLESFLEDKQTGYRVNSERYKTSQSDSHRTVPLKTVYISDAENVIEPPNSQSGWNSIIPHDQNYNIGTTQPISDQLIWRSNKQRTVRLKFDMDFMVAAVDYTRATNKEMAIELRRSELVGINDVLVSREVLLLIDKHHTHINEQYLINIDRQEYFEENESLSIVIRTSASLGDGISKGEMDTYLDVQQCSVLIQDETPYESTVSRCVKPFDLFERLVAKITGKNGLFKSTVFGPGGEYEHMVVDNGFWARGFPDEITDSNGEVREIQFNTSWKEAFESYNYLEPLTYFTEIDGNKEVVRIEKATHTMMNFVGVKLLSVDNLEEESSGVDYFSNITIGHIKTLDYEEINGLDEPNGLTEFTTHVTKNDSKYEIKTNYRFDAVGYELIRRFGFIKFPKKDTSRDSDVFMHDAKFISGVYVHNLWGDHFDEVPQGVFDPSTAWNLRLSPMNRLYYGHGYSVVRGLYHYPNRKVRFNSSNANQNLITVMGGVTLYEGGENATILNKSLGKPRVEATNLQMSFKITQDIEKQLEGTTTVNGEEIPNYFGLFEYQEKGVIKYGRLVKLEADDESKLTLIKARL